MQRSDNTDSHVVWPRHEDRGCYVLFGLCDVWVVRASNQKRPHSETCSTHLTHPQRSTGEPANSTRSHSVPSSRTVTLKDSLMFIHNLIFSDILTGSLIKKLLPRLFYESNSHNRESCNVQSHRPPHFITIINFHQLGSSHFRISGEPEQSSVWTQQVAQLIDDLFTLIRRKQSGVRFWTSCVLKLRWSFLKKLQILQFLSLRGNKIEVPHLKPVLILTMDQITMWCERRRFLSSVECFSSFWLFVFFSLTALIMEASFRKKTSLTKQN